MDRSLPQPRIRKNRLAWAYGVFKAQGPFGVLRCIGRSFVDAGFDIRYGTDTARWVEMHTLSVQGEHQKDALPYIPTQISPLRTVLRKLDLPKDGTFIDLGSGKGRVLLIAAQCGFQRIVGVEFSRELCEIARENVKIFLRQTQITAQIEIIESDVATWPVHREDNVRPSARIVLKVATSFVIFVAFSANVLFDKAT